MQSLVGKTLGKYRVMEQLGRGGMAIVFKAYHAQLDRYVAVKVLQSFLVEGEDFRARFDREAKSVAKLRHRNIVQVFDFDVQDDLPFMVMDYIEGSTLKARLSELARRDKSLSLEEVLRLFRPIANALEYAHRKGLMHRDVKPANVLIDSEGRVYLTDFGIARIASDTAFTASGAFLGTPAYMAPEQAMGKPVTRACDIYSLGIVLYELVTGRVPFEADTPFAVIQQHIGSPLPLPSELRTDIPDPLERTILRALSKEPEDRFATAEAMLSAVEQAITAGLPPEPEEEVVRPAPSATVAEPTTVRQPVPAEAPTVLARPSPLRKLAPFIAAGGVLIALGVLLGPRLLGGLQAAPGRIASPSTPSAIPPATDAPLSVEEETEPQSELAVEGPGSLEDAFPAVLRLTSTSDWALVDMLPADRWIDAQTVSSSPGADASIIDGRRILLEQACAHAEACRLIEAVVHVTVSYRDSGGDVALRSDRGAWGWSKWELLNAMGPEPIPIASFLHNSFVEGGIFQTVTAEQLTPQLLAYVEIGSVIVGRGLSLGRSEGDGLHEAVELGGVQTRWTAPMLEGAQASYLYFTIDDDFLFDQSGQVEIRLEYFDNSKETIELHYDAAPAGSDPDSPDIYRAIELLQRTRTDTWKQASIQIGDARFANNQQGLYDFRLATGISRLAVRRVEVRLLP